MIDFADCGDVCLWRPWRSPLRAEINSFPSCLQTPTVQYMINCPPFASIWIYFHPTACCVLFFQPPVLQTILKCAWLVICGLAAWAQVIATGAGNRPAVRVWTAKMGWLSSRPGWIPDPVTVVEPIPDLYPSTLGFHRVWFDSSVPISSSPFGFHINGLIQICYCYSWNIDIGIERFIFDRLAASLCKTSILTRPTISWQWALTDCQR